MRHLRDRILGLVLLMAVVGCEAGETANAASSTEAPADETPASAAAAGNTEKVGAYAIGFNQGEGLKAQGVELDTASFLAGMTDALNGKAAAYPETERTAAAQQVVQRIQGDMQRKAEAADQQRAAEADANLKKANEFLATNGQRSGVKTTASGLQYEVLTEGSGAKPTANDNVRVHYVGKLTDGKQFDSSIDRGQPAEFPLSGVIAGWTEGLQLMSVGSKYRLFVPPNLGYGPNGAGADIPANAALIFDVELLAINPSATVPAGHP